MTLDVNTKANGSVQGRAESRPDDYGSMYGGVLSLILQTAGAADRFIPYSYFPAARDAQLRRFWKQETMMAGGVFSITSRVASLDSDILSDLPRKKRYAQDLFAEAEFGQGYRVLSEKLIQDFLTQDNGGFIELVGRGRPDKPMIGPVTSFNHMDSAQCYRTYNKEYPVIYSNPQTGNIHKMHTTRVTSLSQLTAPDELARGMGFCAVSRALQAAQYIRAVQVFKDEKVSGRFTRAIGYGRGFNREHLKNALEVNEITGKAAGYMMYRGIPFIIPPGTGIADVELKLLDLASLGDGFNYMDEITVYVYMLALAFGTDARDFWPATASGATKGDATVQNMKARGKALADIIQKLEFILTRRILRTISPTLEFKYDFVDDDADEQQALIHEKRVNTISAAKSAGFITAEEGRAQLIANGVLIESALQVAPDLTQEAAPSNESDAQETLDAGDVGDDGALIQRESKASRIVRWMATQKAIQASRIDFESGVEDLLLEVQKGNVTRVKFSYALRNLITVYSRKAFLDGLSDGGIADGEIEGDDATILNAHIRAQSQYVTALGDSMYGADGNLLAGYSGAGIEAKASLWFSNSIYPAYELGRYSADANGLYEWVLGAAEKHCLVCPKLAGQKHRLKHWHERGLIPKAGELPCNGGCKCSLVKTTGKSQGRFV